MAFKLYFITTVPCGSCMLKSKNIFRNNFMACGMSAKPHTGLVGFSDIVLDGDAFSVHRPMLLQPMPLTTATTENYFSASAFIPSKRRFFFC